MPGPLLRFGGIAHSSSFYIGQFPADKRYLLERRSSTDSSQHLGDWGVGAAMEHLKRNSLVESLTMGHKKDKGKRKDTPSPARPAKPTNKLDLEFESPPNIFYGNPNTSTGALLSGMLRMTILDPEVMLETFKMELQAIVTSTHPVSKNCPDCTRQTTVLNTWTFIRDSKRLVQGQHSFPFSYLLPGHLPATTRGRHGILEYSLFAKATTQPNRPSTPVNSTPASPISPISPSTPMDHEMTVRKPLEIMRAIAPLPEKNSLRIFPPTNLTAHVTYSPIVHPIGDNNVYMRLNGTTQWIKDHQNRWRLRRLQWWLEEKETMISPACTRHSGKLGGDHRGQKHEETRVIGSSRLEEGWKTDLSEGTIECEFSYRPNGAPRPLCDVESPTGLAITHALVIELVIDEWFAPNKSPLRASPTGAARVLRMSFVVMITERSGMGISWDEEQPPMYEDVPPSPPMYALDAPIGDASATIRDYTGPPLGDPPAHVMEEELEGFDPNETPRGAVRQAEQIRLQQDGDEAYPVLSEAPIPGLGLDVNDFETEEEERRWAARREEEEENGAQEEEDMAAGTSSEQR